MLKAASNCGTKAEFKQRFGNAYRYAWRNNFLEEACSHMESDEDSWTEEKIRAEALKYETRTAFAHGCNVAYRHARVKGILEEVCQHMNQTNNKI